METNKQEVQLCLGGVLVYSRFSINRNKHILALLHPMAASVLRHAHPRLTLSRRSCGSLRLCAWPRRLWEETGSLISQSDREVCLPVHLKLGANQETGKGCAAENPGIRLGVMEVLQPKLGWFAVRPGAEFDRQARRASLRSTAKHQACNGR